MARSTRSEAESKRVLARYGVPMARESTAPGPEAAVAAAEAIGFPVVLKLCGAGIAHKTERGLVRLGLGNPGAVHEAAAALLGAARPDDGPVELLVGEMLTGNRELIAGVHTDEQFGRCVMLGIGGVFAEALADVVFRLAPLTRCDAEAMIDGLRMQAVLGAFRGEPPVDRDALARVLLALSALTECEPDVVAVDVNPLVVVGGVPVAVDALLEVDDDTGPLARPPAASRTPGIDPVRFRALFEPRGILVAGASSHPGKFGFVALHNILRYGYEGEVYATNRDGGTILGVPVQAGVDELPAGAVVDQVFVCTPAGANVELLRACAARGATAAFVTSAGYSEAGAEGARVEAELVDAAEALGILLAGPNGQGVVSTPASLCAQIVSPFPPAGRIAIASQSGNFVSSFQNFAVQTGVGVSRAVSAGNAAAIGIADYLEYFATDPATAVSLAYVEGMADGRAFFERIRATTASTPLVLLKGGTTAGGQRAAASHTGSLASDDRVFDGMCRQAGITRAGTVEEAFEAAATFATQPLPRGPRVAVLTTAGGWGVVAADAIASSPLLELLALPDDLRAAIDEHLPPRWSRNNPVDLAGAETRDTIPTVMGLIADHAAVDAVVYLGLGIQSNQARSMRTGRFYPDHGLERIVEFHERQDRRYAEAAAAVSERTGKPVLTATELAVTQPDNAGPAAVRASGRLCYPSANRAVRALEHLWAYARYRGA
ncbi:MAG: acetate--CoA ligase family protein [Acidimicrobiia bacterium]